MSKYRIIVSGGGTGGHIFPALSIANALRRRLDVEIIFVGAEGRMEMEKVPAAGYKIIGLPVQGFDRKNLLRNFGVLRNFYKSVRKARKLIKDFRPDLAVGVGGYASGPVLKMAQNLKIPTLIQEQNSYAGVTNKMLARKAGKICTAYEGMERFFPADRIVMTGNPVRKEIAQGGIPAAQARERFGLRGNLPTVLVVGGSLGARTINESISAGLDKLTEAGVQVIWQTGKFFGTKGEEAAKGRRGVVVTQFISDMTAAYSAASLVVSRAGASSISELELLGKPCVLVPSPNVAEDHQTKNALALSERNAAVLVPDKDARSVLVDTVLTLINDPKRLKEMGGNVRKLACENSDERIVDEIIKLIEASK